MTRGLSNHVKRVVAGVCALTMVSGTLPVQPLAQFATEIAVKANADTLNAGSSTWSADSTITEDVTIDGFVNVTADLTLTIPENTTLTVNNCIDAYGHTVTVAGKGNLVIYGENGYNGEDGEHFGGDGGNGGSGFLGNLIVNGAKVKIFGGNGGSGGNGGDDDPESEGGSGGDGAPGVSGNVTVNSGSAYIVGGYGGDGGSGNMYGAQGMDGPAVDGYIYGETVQASDNGESWVDGNENSGLSSKYVRLTGSGVITLSADTDYAAPTTVDPITYTGNEVSLVANPGSIDPSKGKILYSTSLYSGDLVETNNETFTPVVGNVYKPTGREGISFKDIENIYFIVGDDSGSNVGHKISKYKGITGKQLFAIVDDTDSSGELNSEFDYATYDAILVTRVDGSDLYCQVVNTADLVEANWSTEPPIATDVGNYTVYWRIEAAEGYKDVPTQALTTSIAKGDAAITTAPAGVKTGYTGDEISLVTAGEFAESVGDNAQFEYGVMTEVVPMAGNDILVTPEIGKVYKPTGDRGIFFDGYKYVKYKPSPDSEFSDAYDISKNYDNSHDFANIGLYETFEYRDLYFGNYEASFNADYFDAILVTGLTTEIVSGVEVDVIECQLVKAANYHAEEIVPVDDPKGTDVGKYDVYWRVKSDIYNETEWRMLDPKPEITKGTISASDYTAPTASASLEYTGSEQALINEGRGLDASKGTFEYAKGVGPVKWDHDSHTVYEPHVGDVITPNGGGGVFFPVGYKVKVGDNTYEGTESNLGINLWISGTGNHYASYCTDGGGLKNAWGNRDSFKVLSVDNDAKVIKIEFINADDYLDSLEWSADVPTGKDEGDYSFVWRIKGTDNYNNVKGGALSTKIVKLPISYTEPTANSRDYDGTEQPLLNAGKIAEADAGKGTIEYGVETKVEPIVRNTQAPVSIDDMSVGQVYKPGGGAGVVFPTGYTVVMDGNTFSVNEIESVIMFADHDEYGMMSHAGAFPFPYGYDAVQITNIDKNEKVITATAVKSAEATAITWSENIPIAKYVFDYTVYWRLTPADVKYAGTEAQAINVKISEHAVGYTAPSANNRDYNGEEEALLNAGAIAEADAGKGTIEYGIESKVEPITPSGETPVSIDDMSVGQVYKHGGSADVRFPTGYTVVMDGKTFSAYEYETVFLLLEQDGYGMMSHANFSKLPNGTDAVQITNIDKNEKVITVTAVKSAEVKAITWSGDVPTATNADDYTVLWRVKPAEDGYLGTEVQSINVKISKANIAAEDYTVPTANSRTYDGEEEVLVNAGEISADKGKFEYALGTEPVQRNTRDVYEPHVGDVITPYGGGGVYFAKGYSLKVGDNTYSNDNNSNNGINLYAYNDSHYVFNCSDISALSNAWGNYDSFRVLSVDNDAQVIEIQFINADEYLDSLVWSENVPTATNAGDYQVSWRIKAADSTNINDVKGGVINVKIAKADIDPATYTAPTHKNVIALNKTEGGEFDDTDLITAGSFIDTATDAPGTFEYGIKGENDQYAWQTAVPTTKAAGEFTVGARIKGDANHNDVVFDDMDVTVLEQILGWFTFEDDVLISTVPYNKNKPMQTFNAKLEPETGLVEGKKVYKLEAGETYYVYGSKALSFTGNEDLIDIEGGKRKPAASINGKEYNYSYTIGIGEDIVNESLYEFMHIHSLDLYSYKTEEGVTEYDKSKLHVECTTDTDKGHQIIAELTEDTAYYYGMVPSTDNVVVTGDFDNTKYTCAYGVSITKGRMYFTHLDDTHELSFADMTVGDDYYINAVVDAYDPYTKTGKNFILQQKMTYQAKPLYLCNIYLSTDGKELVENPEFNAELPESETNKKYTNGIKLEVESKEEGENTVYSIDLPDDQFTYNSKDQKPVIYITNMLGDTLTQLKLGEPDAEGTDYAFDCEAQKSANTYTGTLEGVGNYSGTITVNWKIAEKDIDVNDFEAEFNGAIYDGLKLTAGKDATSDFTVSAKEGADELVSEFLDGATYTVKYELPMVEEQTEPQFADIVNAGTYTATITISKDNFKSKTITVENVTVDRRKVNITPDLGQKTKYNTAAGDVTFKVEQAGTGDTGLIAADIPEGKTADTYFGENILDIKGYNRTDISANDVGKYDYLFDDSVKHLVSGAKPVITKEVQVGDENSNNMQNMPVNSAWKYSSTASIYTSAELAGLTDISELSYYHKHQVNSCHSETNAIAVYISETDKTGFNEREYVDVSAMTKVYEGEWNVTDGWNKITLDQSFTRTDTTKNLMIAFVETASAISPPGGHYMNTPDSGTVYRSISYFNDYNTVLFNGNNTAVKKYVPIVKFGSAEPNDTNYELVLNTDIPDSTEKNQYEVEQKAFDLDMLSYKYNNDAGTKAMWTYDSFEHEIDVPVDTIADISFGVQIKEDEPLKFVNNEGAGDIEVYTGDVYFDKDHTIKLEVKTVTKATDVPEENKEYKVFVRLKDGGNYAPCEDDVDLIGFYDEDGNPVYQVPGYWTVAPAALTDIELDPTFDVYSSKDITTAITVYGVQTEGFDTEAEEDDVFATLTKDTDYTIEFYHTDKERYEDLTPEELAKVLTTMKDDGKYLVVAKGKGNYTGNVCAQFTVNNGTITPTHFTLTLKDNIYDGTLKTFPDNFTFAATEDATDAEKELADLYNKTGDAKTTDISEVSFQKLITDIDGELDDGEYLEFGSEYTFPKGKDVTVMTATGTDEYRVGSESIAELNVDEKGDLNVKVGNGSDYQYDSDYERLPGYAWKVQYNDADSITIIGISLDEYSQFWRFEDSPIDAGLYVAKYNVTSEHFDEATLYDAFQIKRREVTITPDADQTKEFLQKTEDFNFAVQEAESGKDTGRVSTELRKDEDLSWSKLVTLVDENGDPFELAYNTDAGTYSFGVFKKDEVNVEFNNYDVKMADETFTVTPYDLEAHNKNGEVVVTLTGDGLIYDGVTKHKINIESVTATAEGLEEPYTLTENTDYILGGSYMKFDAGKYSAYIVGQKNFSNSVKQDWIVKSRLNDTASVTFDKDVDNKKFTSDDSSAEINVYDDIELVYDGESIDSRIDVEPGKVEYTDEPDIKINYYNGDEYDAYEESLGTNDPADKPTPLEEAPVDAGSYVVEITITDEMNSADAYNTAQTTFLFRSVKIIPRSIKVQPVLTAESYQIGDEEPTIDHFVFTANNDTVFDDDKDMLSAELWNDTADSIYKKDENEFKASSEDPVIVCNNYSVTCEPVSYEYVKIDLKDKNVKINLNNLALQSGNFTSLNDAVQSVTYTYTEKATGEEKVYELMEGDDFVFGDDTNNTPENGSFTVEIEAPEGCKKFKGYKSVKVEVENLGVAVRKSTNVDLGESLKLNVMFELPEAIKNDNDAYVTYTYCGKTTTLKVSELNTDSNGYAVIQAAVIPAMAQEKVVFKLFNGKGIQVPMQDKDGTDIAETGYSISLFDYLDALKNNFAPGSKWYNVAVATKDYCIATNQFLSDDPIDEQLSDLTKNVKAKSVKSYLKTESDLPSNMSSVTMNLDCQNVTTFALTFNLNKSIKASEYSCTIDGEEVDLVKRNNRAYYVLYDNISANHLGNTHRLELKHKGEVVYWTEFSALSYGAAIMNSSYAENPKYANFAKALYAYNKYAVKAFGDN